MSLVVMLYFCNIQANATKKKVLKAISSSRTERSVRKLMRYHDKRYSVDDVN